MPNSTVPNPTLSDVQRRMQVFDLPLDETSDPMGWADSTQELLDTLPAQWSRGLLYLIVSLGATLLPWSMLSKVDEIGTARGRIEPKGKTVRLDAPITGTVAAVKVKEGQRVKKGEPLMEIKSDLIRNELQQAKTKLESQLDRVTQLQSLGRQLTVSLQTQRAQLRAQLAEQVSEGDRFEQRIVALENSAGFTQQVLSKDQARADRFAQFRAEGIISGVQMEDAERAAIETRQRLGQLQADRLQAITEAQKQRSTYERVSREGELGLQASERQIRANQGDIMGLRSEIAQSRQQIQALELQLKQTQLSVPVEGTIFELPVVQPGAVVQPGQMLASIAPKDAPLVLRAQLPSAESGFVKVGLPVKIKFDAFPFQEYGIVAGKVRWVSPDSKLKGNQEVFDIEVELSQTFIRAGTKTLPISPGQTANGEIVIRQRRVIDFFLDPFRRLQKDGINL
jgi:hemolysin D